MGHKTSVAFYHCRLCRRPGCRHGRDPAGRGPWSPAARSPLSSRERPSSRSPRTATSASRPTERRIQISIPAPCWSLKLCCPWRRYNMAPLVTWTASPTPSNSSTRRPTGCCWPAAYKAASTAMRMRRETISSSATTGTEGSNLYRIRRLGRCRQGRRLAPQSEDEQAHATPFGKRVHRFRRICPHGKTRMGDADSRKRFLLRARSRSNVASRSESLATFRNASHGWATQRGGRYLRHPGEQRLMSLNRLSEVTTLSHPAANIGAPRNHDWSLPWPGSNPESVPS